MLLAYLDEFGHVGPYIGSYHSKFYHHPVFGYAGFVVPSDRVQNFTSRFEYKKKRQFRAEIQAENAHAARWEKKGAEILSTGSYRKYPENVKMIEDLTGYLRQLGGNPFFYGQVKPLGTASSSGETSLQRSSHALRQAVSRLARYADWLCASVTRATHFHFVEGSEFASAPAVFRRIFTRYVMESRLWIREQSNVVSAGAIAHDSPWHKKNRLDTLSTDASKGQQSGPLRVRKRVTNGKTKG
jgi:hypothetical protein